MSGIPKDKTDRIHLANSRCQSVHNSGLVEAKGLVYQHILPPPPQLDAYLMVRFSEMENLPEKLLEGWFNNMISPGLKPDNTFS